jgi:hypothetical protein
VAYSVRPMKPSFCWRRVSLLTCLTPLLVASFAAAQEPVVEGTPPISRVECARAFEDSQRLRNAARYLEATREVLLCTNPACGIAVSEECVKIYGELQLATPSVVFGARSGAGLELRDARVIIDGGSEPVRIDGKPVAIDPGSHTFSFSADGFAPQVQSVVILAGERFRAITATLAPVGAVAPGSAAPPSLAATDGSDTRAPGPPLGSYVLGGVAVLSVGAGVALRIWGANEFDDLSRECKPECSQGSVDAVERKYLLSNVALAVGGAAAIAGVVVYFVSARSSQPSASLLVGPSGGGVSARVTASF